MAFLGILVMNLIFFFIMLALIVIIGIILLIIGLNNKRKNKKGYKIIILLSIILLMFPIATVGYIVVNSVTSTVVDYINEKKDYNSIVDKWKNVKYINYYRPQKEILNAFFEGMNNHDKAAIKELFCEKEKNSSLDEKINEIFDSYPGYLTTEYFNDKYTSSPGWSSGRRRTFSNSWLIEKDNRTFSLFMKVCYYDENDSSNIGINSLEFYEKRYINDTWKKFTNINRSITEEEAKKTLENIKTFSEFEKKYGKPNIIEDNFPVTKVYYELTPYEDAFYYVIIEYSSEFVGNVVLKDKIDSIEFVKTKFSSDSNN